LSMKTTEVTLIEQAFLSYRADVYRFLLRRMRDHHDAEELTQQVFTDAVSTLSRAGPPTAMRGWLYAIAERRLVDELRRRERDARVAELLVSEPSVPSGHTSHALEDAVGHLPPSQRQLVLMRIVEERSYREIARVLGSNEAACKMRLSRALRRLRNELVIAS
jgi:RNA polymerase sigma factor (sigma-70 family)